MAKKLMILGAGQLQIPAIKTARAMGLEVITLDKNPKAPGVKYANHAMPVDFMDREASVEIAKRFHIDGVLTISSDLPVPTVGRICDELGLVGITEEIGELCSNKLLMCDAFHKYFVPSPEYVEASNEQEAVLKSEKLKFPLMVKTPDSSGSRGVIKAEEVDEIPAAFQKALKYSRCGKVCIEEFVEGVEFGTQAVVCRGETKLMLPHNDMVSEPPYYVPIGHSFPFSSDGFDTKAIENVARAGIQALGIQDGGVNLDFIYASNGPQIIEIGARLGGTCLPELVQLHSGINIIQEVIHIALGEEPDLKIKTKEPVAALLITSDRSGIVENIEISKNVYGIKQLLELSFDVEVGEEVNQFTSGPDRIGQIIVTGDCATDAESCAKTIRSLVRLHIV